MTEEELGMSYEEALVLDNEGRVVITGMLLVYILYRYCVYVIYV